MSQFGSIKARLELIDKLIDHKSKEQAFSKDIQRLKILKELLREQVPNENTNSTIG